MATNKLDIWNLSLVYIGHTRKVTSPTEESTERRNCEAVYEQRKQSLLTMAKWGFAKRQVALSLTGNTVAGWNYEYYYPQNCLKALEIVKDSLNEKRVPYQTASIYNDETGAENRVIWTNRPNASLLFIGNVNNVTMMTPGFVETLAHHMGVPLSRLMSKNSKTASEMQSLTQYYLQQAIIQNEAEALDEDDPDAAWITEAYGDSDGIDLNRYRKT